MELSYQCHGHSGMKPNMWTGQIRLFNTTLPCEMEVNTQGSYFHILCGRHEYGNYICIPNWNIGTELSNLTDSFWNLEHLVNTYPELSMVDAISISDALAAVAEYLET